MKTDKQKDLTEDTKPSATGEPTIESKKPISDEGKRAEKKVEKAEDEVEKAREEVENVKIELEKAREALKETKSNLRKSKEELRETNEPSEEEARRKQEKLESAQNVVDKDIFDKLQGNILKFHGRKYAYHLFIKFDHWKQDSAKQWIVDLTNDHITSMTKQLEESKAFKQNNLDEIGIFTSLGLSNLGYSYLQLRVTPSDIAFIYGMKARQKMLGDKDWDNELAYYDGVHAVLIIAADDKDRLDERKREIEEELTGIGRIAIAELGSVQKNEKGQVVMENGFGYRDGMSSPLYLKSELEKYKKKQEKFDKDSDPLKVFNPGSKLEEVLINDNLTRDVNAYGSYYVFRKYDLNTTSFNQQIEGIAKALILNKKKQEEGKEITKLKPTDYEDVKVDTYHRELAFAYVMGRFRDGTPLVKGDMPLGEEMGAQDNTFDFESDPYGAKCPFHAHIRKMNPRKNLPDNEPYYPKATIVRRGLNQKVGKTITGLLFGCYQASITNQFEKLQVGWGNISWEPAGRAGVDPIIGNDLDKYSYILAPEMAAEPNVGLVPYRKDYSFPINWGKRSNMPFDLDNEHYFRHDFDSHTKMVGGDYFFFPSIPGLKALKKVDAPVYTNTPMLQRLQYVVTRLWTSEEDFEMFKADYRTCMNEWLGLNMKAHFIIEIVEDKPVPPEKVFRVENGYVITQFDISGKPTHLSKEEIESLDLKDFMEYNKLSLVTASVMFNPYFLMGW